VISGAFFAGKLIIYFGFDLGTLRTTPLPDRNALEMILEKLQKCVFYIFWWKHEMGFDALTFDELDFLLVTVQFCRKDTYRVFAEPVDLEEVRAFHFLAMLARVAN
jgi:hypothetical protein